MQRHILFSAKNKKNVISLSSAEFHQDEMMRSFYFSGKNISFILDISSSI